MDDLIRLGAKCNQINYWTFPPRWTRCPSHRCTIDFGTRSAAINHFRKRHAAAYIYCCYCDKPVYAPSIKKFKAHFEKLHPEHSLENDASMEDQPKSNVCR